MSKQESLIETLTVFKEHPSWDSNKVVLDALLYLVENTPELEAMRQNALEADGCPTHCDHAIGRMEEAHAGFPVCQCDSCLAAYRKAQPYADLKHADASRKADGIGCFPPAP